jgi:hypothetical protein
VKFDSKEHEEKLISSFILKEKRGRWRTLLFSDDREVLTSTFDHKQDFDPRFATHMKQAQILEKLREVKGLTKCFLLSANREWDDSWATLDELEIVLFEESGTYISCVPGELAVYHGEDVGENYLLTRKQA